MIDLTVRSERYAFGRRSHEPHLEVGPPVESPVGVSPSAGGNASVKPSLGKVSCQPTNGLKLDKLCYLNHPPPVSETYQYLLSNVSSTSTSPRTVPSPAIVPTMLRGKDLPREYQTPACHTCSSRIFCLEAMVRMASIGPGDSGRLLRTWSSLQSSDSCTSCNNTLFSPSSLEARFTAKRFA